MEPVKISSPQNAQTTHAARAKAPAQQAVSDSGSEAGTSGFLALLAAMGDASGDAVSLAASDAALTPADLTADVATGVGDASAAAWHGLFGAIANDGSGAIAADTGADLALATTFGASKGSAWDALALDGRSQGLVAETMKLDTSVDLNDGPPLGATAGLSRAFSRLQGAQSQRSGSGSPPNITAGQIAVGDSSAQRFGGLTTTAAIVQAMNERVSPGAQHMGASGERASSVFTSLGGTELTGAAALAGGAVAAVVSGSGVDSSGGGRASDGHTAPNAGVEAGSVASAPETAGADGGTTFSDAHPMGAEEQVADQVAYWVNQKTQNAEMTLQRDGQPVEVSVSLSGNEAHVSFRSDQQETRALLDQSMAQLSDLLRSEGLVLSGMSVGTSEQGGAGSKGDPGASGGRDNSRQAQVVSKAPAGTASLVRGVVASDRAVDIFV